MSICKFVHIENYKKLFQDVKKTCEIKKFNVIKSVWLFRISQRPTVEHEIPLSSLRF